MRDFVIGAAGDIACSPVQRATPPPGACGERATSDVLLNYRLDAVLTLGDNQYEVGSLQSFREVFDKTWGRLRPLLRPVPGNHEYGTRGAAGYFDYFGKAAGARGRGYYSFDVGPWHFIALNSNCAPVGGCGPGSPQERWLRADLASHRNTCTLAYWHHARFSSGLHGSDERFDAFWRALYAADADVVLSGHDHDYERFAPQDPGGRRDPERGIRQFVVGTGGRNLYGILYGRPNSEFRYARTFGVLLLTLNMDSYDWRFLDAAGETVETGTDRCH